MTAHDSKRRLEIPLDDERIRHYQGGDEFPADSLLVLIHPKTYRDIRLNRAFMTITGPEAAAAFIDGACRQTPDLADRMGWKVLGVASDDDDE